MVGIFENLNIFEVLDRKDISDKKITELLTSQALYALNNGRTNHSEINTL